MASPGPLTVGTAGHIDHGKTALVEALTGTNTDRLAQEAERGISIELGFAPLKLPDGRNLSVVDVPGHDRLVRTMISGATGIDFFLLVVAADDGVMQQTREHVAVLRALGITDGVVALTKCDLADEEVVEWASEEVHDLVPDARVVRVSARTGHGLTELRAALAGTADRVEGSARGSATAEWAQPATLHVDRVFSLRGIGTIVTGTLRGASLLAGEQVDILPRGTQARVRAIHVHDRAVEEAMPAQRVALNLAGISTREVDRGDLISTVGSGLRPSYRLDAELSLAGPAESLDGERVQIHHGTRNSPAKLVHLDEDGRFVQLRLEFPLTAAAGDRVVIRRIAPPSTVGGGRVIDPVPVRHGRGHVAERLRLVSDGQPRELLSLALAEGPIPAESEAWRHVSALAPALERHPRDQWERALRELQDEEAMVVRDGTLARPTAEPSPPIVPSEDLAPLDESELAVLEVLRADGLAPRSSQALAEALGIERDAADRVLKRLARAGAVTAAPGGIYYETVALQRAREQVVALAAARDGSISLAEVRDELQTSRKYAQALLEHLDSEAVMIRRGERHHLRKHA